jgi:hypothetical protein
MRQDDGIPFPVINSSSSSSAKSGNGSTSEGDKVQRQRLSKESAILSRTLPGCQRRRSYLDAVEQSLLSHPLALYPHLENALDSDLFDSVLEVLDPSLAGASATSSEVDDDDLNTVKEGTVTDDVMAESTLGSDQTSSHRLSPIKEQTVSDAVKRPSYRWPMPLQRPMKPDDSLENSGSRKGSKTTNKEQLSAQFEDPQIRSATREFCEWVKDLGGDSQGTINEETLQSLFTSGSETKPAFSVPIHVVELMNVPAELRLNRLGPSASSHQSYMSQKDNNEDTTPYIPSWVERGRQYGAWYLPKQLWQQKSQMKSLKDPKEERKKEMSAFKKRMEAMDTAVGPLHGTQAFKEFVYAKNKRMPKMLSTVMTEEDQIRLKRNTQEGN